MTTSQLHLHGHSSSQVMITGVYPARRIALASMVAMNVCARWAGSLHELVLPIAGIWVRREENRIESNRIEWNGMEWNGIE